MKTTGYRPIILILLLIFSLSVTGQTLSVKGRWNVKAGYSLYKLTTSTVRPIEFDWTKTSLMYKSKWNVRVEVNYGVLKWLETGIYVGLMGYEYNPPPYLVLSNYPDAVAPTFGVNVNVHLLPLFVKNPNCKWDFYIPLKYGGNYIPKYGNGRDAIVFSLIDTWDNVTRNMTLDEYIEYKKNTLSWSKYRHEYGAGLGAAVYIKNIIGFYAEVMGGQFSYFPEIVRSPYNIRVGLTAKF